ncbi:MAG: WD40 repeat domain-containing protein [Planctomycetaceae bacterium]
MRVLNSDVHRRRTAQALAELFQEFKATPAVLMIYLQDPESLRGELRQRVADHSLWIEWLARGLEQGIYMELDALPEDAPHAPIVPTLMARLRALDQTVPDDFLVWVIDAWAIAMGRTASATARTSEPVCWDPQPRSVWQIIGDVVCGMVGGAFFAWPVEWANSMVVGWKLPMFAALIAGLFGSLAGIFGALASTTSRIARGAVIGGVSAGLIVGISVAVIASGFSAMRQPEAEQVAALTSFVLLVLAGALLGLKYGKVVLVPGLAGCLITLVLWVFSHESFDPELAWFTQREECEIPVFLGICMSGCAIGFYLVRSVLESVENRRGHLTLRGHQVPLTAVTVSPDGTQLAAADEDFVLPEQFWRVVRRWLRLPDQERVVVDRSLRIWDLRTRREVGCLTGHLAGLAAVGWFPCGRKLVTASRDLTLRIWDIESRSCAHVLEGHRDVPTSVSVSRDGTRVASCSRVGTVRLWDAATGTPLKTVQQAQPSSWPTSVLFAADDARLYVGDSAGTVTQWDVATWECSHCFAIQSAEVVAAESKDEGPTSPINLDDAPTMLAISRDGQSLVASRLKTVALWHRGESSQPRLRTFDGTVTSVCFWQSARMPVVAVDKSLFVWRPESDHPPLRIFSSLSEIRALDGHSERITVGLADRSIRSMNDDCCHAAFEREQPPSAVQQAGVPDIPTRPDEFRPKLLWRRFGRVVIGICFGLVFSLWPLLIVLGTYALIFAMLDAKQLGGLLPRLSMQTIDDCFLPALMLVAPLHVAIGVAWSWNDWTRAVVRSRVILGATSGINWGVRWLSWLSMAMAAFLLSSSLVWLLRPDMWVAVLVVPVVIEAYVGSLYGGCAGCWQLVRAWRARRSNPIDYAKYIAPPPKDYRQTWQYALRWPLRILALIIYVPLILFFFLTTELHTTNSGRGFPDTEAIPIEDILAAYEASPEDAKVEYESTWRQKRRFFVRGVVGNVVNLERGDGSSKEGITLNSAKVPQGLPIAACTWTLSEESLVEAKENKWRIGEERIGHVKKGQELVIYGECLGLSSRRKLLNFRRCSPWRKMIQP